MKPRPRILRLGALLVVWLVPVAAMANEDDPGGMYGSVSVVQVSPLDSKVSTKESWQGGTEHWKSELTMDGSLGFLAAVGYDSGSGWRTELEIGYRKLDLEEERETDDVDDVNEFAEGTNWETLHLMLNGYFMFGQGRLKPYVGLGAGLAKHEIKYPDDDDNDESDTVFAYQGIVGAAYEISDRMEARLGYRYLATGDLSSSRSTGSLRTETKSSYETHNIEAGVVFRF